MKAILPLAIVAFSAAIELQKVPFDWSAWSKCSNGKRYRERLQLQTLKEVSESCCDGTNYEEDEQIHAKDCSDIALAGHSEVGNHWIWISPSNKVQVQCMEHGWTVIQSRGQFGNPKDYFLRKWDSYVKGFGVPGKEYWLGLNNIHDLTHSKRDYRLRITMRTFDRKDWVAFYDNFYLKDRTFYQLHLGTYSGNAGNSFSGLSGHNFTTIDQDHDTWGQNCAVRFKGAWWYSACHSTNLNGYNFGTADKTPYAEGIVWSAITTQYHTLQSVQMSIRPMDYEDNLSKMTKA